MVLCRSLVIVSVLHPLTIVCYYPLLTALKFNLQSAKKIYENLLASKTDSAMLAPIQVNTTFSLLT